MLLMGRISDSDLSRLVELSVGFESIDGQETQDDYGQEEEEDICELKDGLRLFLFLSFRR